VTIDYIAYLLTLLGVAMLIVMRIRGDVRHRNAAPLAAGERVAPRPGVSPSDPPSETALVVDDRPDDDIWSVDDHDARGRAPTGSGSTAGAGLDADGAPYDVTPAVPPDVSATTIEPPPAADR
jgi:hypothetical protein